MCLLLVMVLNNLPVETLLIEGAIAQQEWVEQEKNCEEESAEESQKLLTGGLEFTPYSNKALLPKAKNETKVLTVFLTVPFPPPEFG